MLTVGSAVSLRPPPSPSLLRLFNYPPMDTRACRHVSRANKTESEAVGGPKAHYWRRSQSPRAMQCSTRIQCLLMRWDRGRGRYCCTSTDAVSAAAVLIVTPLSRNACTLHCTRNWLAGTFRHAVQQDWRLPGRCDGVGHAFSASVSNIHVYCMKVHVCRHLILCRRLSTTCTVLFIAPVRSIQRE